MSWVTLPIDVDIKQLDDGDGSEATMMRHHAVWHKTCHLRFNQTKLEQLQKNLGTLAMHSCSSHSSFDQITSASFAKSHLDLKIPQCI